MNELNILVLEDDVIIYMHLVKTLRNMGFTNIYTAKNYTETMKLASEHQFNIMLSDIRIKGEIDGISTAKALQQLQKHIALIFITAYNDKITLSRASEVDFIGYLLKPFREDEVQTMITLALNKYKLLPESFQVKVSEEYTFDSKNNIFYHKDKPVILTKKEQLFMALLVNNLNSVVSYGTVDDIIWQGSIVSDNARRTFIYRMKKRFPELNLQTINSMGIQLSLSAQEDI